MAVLPIRIAGDPVLHSPALPVEDFDEELRTLVARHVRDDGCRSGGRSRSTAGRRAGFASSPTAGSTTTAARWRGVAINPELWITPPPAGEPDVDEESEGCLSFPGERFGLRRAERAILRATDLDGDPFEIEAQGWLARIFQHEFDHLDGTLYIDRLGERDQKLVHKISRKLGWGKPGVQWMPGVDHLED